MFFVTPRLNPSDLGIHGPPCIFGQQNENPGKVSSNLKEGRVQVVLNVIYSILIVLGSIMGLAVITSSVIQINDMSQTSLNSLAKRYWIVFYAFSKDKIKNYQGTNSNILIEPSPVSRKLSNLWAIFSFLFFQKIFLINSKLVSMLYSFFPFYYSIIYDEVSSSWT